MISDFATPSPYTIGKGSTLGDAHRLMRQHHIRHLPVLDGGKLAGIISQRDLYFVETLNGVDPEQVPVEEAMTNDPYIVNRDTSLHSVAGEMWKRRLGSAVVVEGSKVVGVFTTSDAMHALAALLEPAHRARGGVWRPIARRSAPAKAGSSTPLPRGRRER